MKKNIPRITVTLVVLAIVTAILIFMNAYLKADVTDAIDSFEDCAAAGYPIAESYPEQCSVPGGKTFTKQS